MGDLSRAEKRKYAQAISRIEVGITGHKLSLFKTITLTTRKGDDNSTKRFGKDVHNLMARFRRMGYEVEYCGVYELTLKQGLLHWHGILRVKSGYFKLYSGRMEQDKMEHKRKQRRALGDMWNTVHNAFAVQIADVYYKRGIRNYIMKHMMKKYISLDWKVRNKFLVSNGWKPAGLKELVKDFKKWWTNGTNSSWMTTDGYAILNQVIERCCKNERTAVRTKFGHFITNGFRLESAILYEYEDDSGTGLETVTS